MLRKDEFLDSAQTFSYIDTENNNGSIDLQEGQLVFTYCQVPVVYSIGNTYKTVVIYNDRTSKEFDGMGLDKQTSQSVFNRLGTIKMITVYIKEEYLK